jgi:hypothetical protein
MKKMATEVAQKLKGMRTKLEKAKGLEKAPLEYVKLVEAVEGLVEICEFNDARMDLLQGRSGEK